jgi:hypothetical protein
MADAETRRRVSALERLGSQQERWLASLEAKQTRMQADLARLDAEVRRGCRISPVKLSGCKR